MVHNVSTPPDETVNVLHQRLAEFGTRLNHQGKAINKEACSPFGSRQVEYRVEGLIRSPIKNYLVVSIPLQRVVAEPV